MYRTLPLRSCFLLMIGLCAGMAMAQDNNPPSEPAPPAPINAIKNNTETTVWKPTGKYATWVHHVGSAEESVVAVRVTGTDDQGQTITRMGCGFVLRCDGFVILPGVLAPRSDRKFDAEISFAKMDGEDLTAPFAPVIHPTFRHPKVPFVTLKVNDHHFPCLPILNPSNVRPDAAVRITWAIPDEEKPGRVKTFSRKAVIGAKIGREDRYDLKLVEDGPNAPVPILGATVTDEKGIAALGMLSESPTTDGGNVTDLTFTTFAHLDYICDEVGLYPSLADVPNKNAGSRVQGDMIYIPGGPIPVPPGGMGEYYNRLYKTSIVCTPPFLIDKVPVSIGEYRTFLRRARTIRMPQKWELDFPNEMEQDIRRADLPVTGALYEDAIRYAEAQGKRLPTTVEWLEAAQGAKTDWVSRYDIETRSYLQIVSDIYHLKLDHWFAELEDLTRRKGVSKTTRVYVDTPQMRDLSHQQYVKQIEYFHAYNWPLTVNAPVGKRTEDMSAFGVMDVIANAPEMTIKNSARGLSGIAPKPLPAISDMYLTAINYEVRNMETEGLDKTPLVSGSRLAFTIDKEDPAQIDYTFGLLCLSAGNMYFNAIASYTSVSDEVVVGSLVMNMSIHPQNYAGFRCAK